MFRYGGDHHGANQNSGREISSFGPEMCTPQFLRPGVPLRRGSLRYGAHRHSGREISHSGPEMCTPLFLRPKSKPAGREKPIRVAPIRVVTKYPIGVSDILLTDTPKKQRHSVKVKTGRQEWGREEKRQKMS